MTKLLSVLIVLGMLGIISIGALATQNVYVEPNTPAQTQNNVLGASVAPIPSTILNGLRKGGTALVFDWWDYHHYNPTAFNDDLPIIKSKGGGHVRLTMSMNTIEQGTTGKVNTTRWNDLKAFTTLAKNNGLVTIVDVHDTGLEGSSNSGEWTNDYMENLRNSAIKARHLSLLTDIATKMYQDLDRNWTVLQPANEPIFTNSSSDSNIWYNYQNQLIPAIRSACPDCVVFAMAHEWQGVEATVSRLNPDSITWWDARIIPDVHFYDPLELTHCHYPGSSNTCPGKTWPGTFSDWDGSHYYNKATLESKLASLWSWKTQHNIEIVHFSEIGTAASLADSTKGPYLTDLTSILKAHGASWSCWEWDKNFGMYPNHPISTSACFSGSGVVNPTTKYCGDGVVQTPNDSGITEVCDDGNTANNDQCSSDCRNKCTAPQVWNGSACTTPSNQGIIIDTPLTLDRTSLPTSGGTITGTVKYRNSSSSAITLNAVVIAGRPPGGTNLGGPYLDFSPTGTNITIQPNSVYTLTASRTISSTEATQYQGQWYAFATYEDSSGWHDAPGSQNKNFSVGTSTTKPTGCNADYNNNGTIDIADFQTFGQNYKVSTINCSLDVVGNNCYLDIADFQAFGQIYKVTNACM